MEWIVANANSFSVVVLLLLAAFGVHKKFIVPGWLYTERDAELKDSQALVKELTSAQSEIHQANANLAATVPSLLAEIEQLRRGERGS